MVFTESEELQDFKHKLAQRYHIGDEDVAYHDCFYQYVHDSLLHKDSINCPIDEIIDKSVEFIGGPIATWSLFRKMLNDSEGAEYEFYWEALNNIISVIGSEECSRMLDDENVTYMYNKIADKLEEQIGPAEMWRITREHTITSSTDWSEFFSDFLKYAGL